MDENGFYRIEVKAKTYVDLFIYAVMGLLAVLALWQVVYIHSLAVKSYVSSAIVVFIFLQFNHVRRPAESRFVLHLSEQGKLICPKLGLSGHISIWSYQVPFWIFLRINSDVKETSGNLSLCTTQLTQSDRSRFYRILRRIKNA